MQHLDAGEGQSSQLKANFKPLRLIIGQINEKCRRI